ncbi:MAG: 50S ribosomal protein L18 [Gemmatimonadota bacterium]
MSSKTQQREQVRRRRHRRVRRRITGSEARPRLVVHRSLKNIAAQLVDDAQGKTILGVSSQSVRAQGTKIEQARATGKRLAELAREKGVQGIVFDRGGYIYHGRVKALAEGAREGGLHF